MDIVVFENVVDRALCERVVARYLADQRRRRRMPGDYDNRQCESMRISAAADWGDLERELEAIVLRCAEEWLADHHLGLEPKLSGFEVAGYMVGEGCDMHWDGFINHRDPVLRTRLATIIVYLNDCLDGGETVFPTKRFAVRGRTGRIVFFPPGLMHLHCANPVSEGMKVVALTWLVYDPSALTADETARSRLAKPTEVLS